MGRRAEHADEVIAALGEERLLNGDDDGRVGRTVGGHQVIVADLEFVGDRGCDSDLHESGYAETVSIIRTEVTGTADNTNVTMYHTYFNQRNNLVAYGIAANVASRDFIIARA